MINQGQTQIDPNSQTVNKLYDNSHTNIIRISDDKLKVILLEHKQTVEKNSDFINPLILLISIVFTMYTTEFKEALSLPAASWKGIYISIFLASIAWFIISLRNIKRIVSINDLISKIKNSTPTSES